MVRILLPVIIFLMVAGPQNGWAQSSDKPAVEGHITTKEGSTLPTATILVEELQQGTTSDKSGYYSLDNLPAGEYTIRVSMVGYTTTKESVLIQPGKTARVNFTLFTQNYSFGDDLVVTATRTQQAVATAPASISLISAKEIERKPVGDLTDVLRNSPGVSISAGSQGRREIQLRGMDAGHTLLLVDGRRVNSSEAVFRHNDYDLGMLPMGAVDQIEIVRGGMSALYGSEALGGVINVITKPFSDVWNAKVSSEFQTPVEGEKGQEYRTSVYTSGALVKDRLGLTLTGTLNHRNIWHGWASDLLTEDDGSPITRPDGSEVYRSDLATLEGRNDHNARGKLIWTPTGSHTIEAEFGRSYQTRSGEYMIRGWGEADTEINRNDVVLTHKNDFSWGNSVIRGYGEWVDTESDGLSQQNKIVEGNLNASLGNHLLTAGGEARWLNLSAPLEFVSGKAGTWQQAFYVQDEYGLSSRLKVLAGGRLDNHKDFGLKFTPRGYLVYSATGQLTLKGGIGTAFKAPTLRQLSEESVTTSCRGGCVIIGDPDLNPETSTNYEVSANYDSRLWGGSITAFRNEIDNLIDTPRGAGVEPVGYDGQGREMYVPRNVNEARIRGIEATLFANFMNIGRATINYTALDAKDLSNGEELQNRPKHHINGEFNWYTTRQATVFFRGKYIGEQQTMAGSIDPYTMFDIGGTYNLRDKLSIRGGILNIANTRTDDPEADYSFVERPRSVYFGFSLEF